MTLKVPKSAVGIASSIMEAEITKWAQDQHAIYWAEVKGCHQAKSLIGPALRGNRAQSILALGWEEVKVVSNWACTKREQSSSILTLGWDDVKVVTQLLRGHGTLRYHRWKYRFCEMENETSEHVICSWSALIRIRRKTLESYFFETTAMCKLCWAQTCWPS